MIALLAKVSQILVPNRFLSLNLSHSSKHASKSEKLNQSLFPMDVEWEDKERRAIRFPPLHQKRLYNFVKRDHARMSATCSVLQSIPPRNTSRF
mmetsp:Transcript_16466/g.34249  ORF Transcript_16466/g.34249 Transcript_16466/m.34249 type:complete len:94 (-) Transcript_16466:587-868(-)